MLLRTGLLRIDLKEVAHQNMISIIILYLATVESLLLCLMCLLVSCVSLGFFFFLGSLPYVFVPLTACK